MTQKVIFTIGRMNIGGAETEFVQFVKCLRSRAAPVDIIVFVVSGLPGVYDDDLRKLGVKFVYGQTGVNGLFLLWRLCRLENPDVLHINAETAAGFYGFAGLLAGVRKRIAQYRSMKIERPFWLSVKYFIYAKLTGVFCTQLIGVSDAGSVGRYVPKTKWRTIYSGFEQQNSTRFEGLPLPKGYERETTNIIILGRLDHGKNIERGLAVFSTYLKTSTDNKAKLHIVGPEGNVSIAELAGQADKIGIGKSTVFHGPSRTALHYLAKSNVLLMTSRIEGLPRVVLEALSCGTPVVATTLPGVKEIARYTTGVFDVSLDQPNEVWARALQSALRTDRSAIKSGFAKSIFEFERFYAATLDLWGVSQS